MKNNKKLIFAAAVVGVVGAAGIGTTVLAASNDASKSYPPIVQKIASTFGLDPVKVDDVFKQQHQDNAQNRQAKLKSTLDQAVKGGKLTQDQENKLISELSDLHNQNKSDRRQDRQNLKSQLDQWAKDNGITDLDQILPHPGFRHHISDNNTNQD